MNSCNFAHTLANDKRGCGRLAAAAAVFSTMKFRTVPTSVANKLRAQWRLAQVLSPLNVCGKTRCNTTTPHVFFYSRKKMRAFVYTLQEIEVGEELLEHDATKYEGMTTQYAFQAMKRAVFHSDKLHDLYTCKITHSENLWMANLFYKVDEQEPLLQISLTTLKSGGMNDPTAMLRELCDLYYEDNDSLRLDIRQKKKVKV